MSEGDAPELVLDEAAILASFDGDATLMRDSMRLFLAELPGHLTTARAALEAGDFERVQRVAHSLKGTLGYFGANAASSSAQRLETASRLGDREQAARSCMAFEDELALLRRAVEALMRRYV